MEACDICFKQGMFCKGTRNVTLEMHVCEFHNKQFEEALNSVYCLFARVPTGPLTLDKPRTNPDAMVIASNRLSEQAINSSLNGELSWEYYIKQIEEYVACMIHDKTRYSPGLASVLRSIADAYSSVHAPYVRRVAAALSRLNGRVPDMGMLPSCLIDLDNLFVFTPLAPDMDTRVASVLRRIADEARTTKYDTNPKE